MKHRWRWRRGPSEHAVEHERVDVDVQIQGTSEALDHGDRAALAGADTLACGRSAQPAEHDADEDGEHVAAKRGVEGELIAQGPGEREHPLAHGDIGDDVVDEVSSQRAHPATATGERITDRRGRDKQKAMWGERLHEMKQVGIEHHPEWAAKAK